MLSKISKFPPLNLAYVGAVTPSHWDIKVIDENFDPFVFEPADLVGITGFSSNITRAYEIAGIYRERGIKVVLGGIHASMATEEAIQHADAVVVGEVEGVWETVIQDFENNKLQSVYTGSRMDLSDFSILPRRDLLHPEYLWEPVQTSRGCPFNCSFCSVSRYMGQAYRQRKAEDVLAELKGLKGEYVAFVDDNLIGYNQQSKERAQRLFKGMIREKLNKKWWMQTSINSAEDEETIKLAAKAGCMFVFIGFETISGETLREMKKGINIKMGVDNYKKVVSLFHQYGIAVMGAFIIGNDHESPSYYKKLATFFRQSGIDIFQVSVLTPLPGTLLMKNIKNEDRLIYDHFPSDWDKYRFSYLVHKPAGVTPETVYIGDNYLKKSLYAPLPFTIRMAKSYFRLNNKTNFFVAYKLNKALKKSWENSHYYQKYPATFQETTSL
ncbi:MAG: radical SAM protein [Thermodesulfobacteriota bacterium]|nr:radical SAM protein [Thermodesulfobacteriota bacterium]